MGLKQRKWRRSTTLLILGIGLAAFSLIYYGGGLNGPFYTGIPWFVSGMLFFVFGFRRRIAENREFIDGERERSEK